MPDLTDFEGLLNKLVRQDLGENNNLEQDFTKLELFLKSFSEGQSELIKEKHINKLITLLEKLGDLTLKRRSDDHYANLDDLETHATQIINSMSSLTTIDKSSSARYAFLSQFHTNADILTECERLFNTTKCDPYELNTQFNYIIQGRSVNNFSIAETLIKKLLFSSQEYINLRLKDLSKTVDKNNPLANFLDYFKASVKVTNKNTQVLSIDFVNDLSKLAFYLTDVFKETKPKSRIYDSLFSLVLTLLKNPSIGDHHLHIWQAIKACSDQMLVRLTDQTAATLKKPQAGIDSSMNILADIFHQIINIAAVSPADKQEIGEIISKLSIACLKIDTCDSFSALNQFSKTLGNLVRSLSKRNQTQIERNATQAIEATAQKIIQNASSTISESELAGFRWSYLKGRYDNNVIAIHNGCERLFNTSNCQEFIPTNRTTELDIDIITIVPETITNSTTAISTSTSTAVPAVNTTIAPAIKQTALVEDSVIQNITSPVIDDTFTNQTNSILDTPALENAHFAFANKILTSMGLGAFSGFLNGVSQIILHFAEQKNCSLPTQRFLAVTLGIANSFAISTLPLIYSIIENLANDETDSLVNSQKLLTCTYAFITSIVLQSINAGVQYALPKKSILKNLFNMLPLFASLWMLANSDESTIESLAILGANILTALATSSLTYFAFNPTVPTRNRREILAPENRTTLNFNGAETVNSINDVNTESIKMINFNIHEESHAMNDTTELDIVSDTVPLLNEKQTNGFHHRALNMMVANPEYDTPKSNRPVTIIEIKDESPKHTERDIDSGYGASDKSDTKSNTSNRNSLEDPIYEAIAGTDKIPENNYENRPLPIIPSTSENSLVISAGLYKPSNGTMNKTVVVTEQHTVTTTVHYSVSSTN
ncbi:hypothetical protein [Rickettsiella endosymbiont of Aleochara curtula]|uniref:hypothetical protein n=1 Tax=Rickettsiella endosymbiont of Aleochara curtula TaxID=3077936 RepID=UPI00313F357E